MAQVIEYVKANIKQQPAKQTQSPGQRGTKRPRGGNGMGKIAPLKGRHLKFLAGVVLGTETMPDDTIGCWAAPALRHLMLVDGLNPEEALSKIEEFYQMIPDTSFSDRLCSGNVRELLRTDAYTASKIEEGNVYQPEPEQSTAIFARVKARCQQIGFVFADPSTWGVLDSRKGCHFDVSDMDFSLTFEEKLAIKGAGAAILKCDIASVYQAAHRIKAFITKYPGKEMPGSVVPHLCAGLPISWQMPSDNGTRCKKAERFLRLLCSLGIIKLIKLKQWFGRGHSRNRATTYGLPQDESTVDLGIRWYHARQGLPSFGKGKGECIYIRDESPFTDDDITELVLENQRLSHVWVPRYHNSG